MEDSPLTQVTLDIVRRIPAQPECAAPSASSSSLTSTARKLTSNNFSKGIRIRLCKGAYKEPAEVAYPKKADIDTNYVRLSNMLLKRPIYHGLATHDEA